MGSKRLATDQRVKLRTKWNIWKWWPQTKWNRWSPRDWREHEADGGQEIKRINISSISLTYICHIVADERSALIYRASHICVEVVLWKYCTTFMAKLRCDGKNVATSRSPNAGWLAVHFWPTARKMESFQRVTGILGQTLQIFPIQQISTCKLASNKCWNQPIFKTCQVPPQAFTGGSRFAGIYFTAPLRRCSLADCRRLTDLPNSSSCPFYPPSSLCFPLPSTFSY